MLTGEQLDGLNDLLDGMRGVAGSDGDSRRERMKRSAAAALQKLTRRQRRVLTLLYVEGLTQQAAAKRLGRSQSAVSRMHGRAIVRLQKLTGHMR